ncbi:dUTP diphosphatase [Pseudoalteromonas sp.]|uniref:dUTP diphosphatase n=1 Tax=Pseudoalteromonas sp. TaxID=53249 RepID=UPI00260222A9|nr:dUTP diphosphatase [Pseudoalteromonas sp.]MCP4588248.1 dUTP diphosphatase [Pseudoalteromonas sp.]
MRFTRLTSSAYIPTKRKPGAAGFDICSPRYYIIPACTSTLIPIDLAISLPEGSYGRIFPQSSLNLKHSIITEAGVIESDFRANLSIMLFNLSLKPFNIVSGQKICQLIIQKVYTSPLEQCMSLNDTFRGTECFGSTTNE